MLQIALQHADPDGHHLQDIRNKSFALSSPTLYFKQQQQSKKKPTESKNEQELMDVNSSEDNVIVNVLTTPPPPKKRRIEQNSRHKHLQQINPGLSIIYPVTVPKQSSIRHRMSNVIQYV